MTDVAGRRSSRRAAIIVLDGVGVFRSGDGAAGLLQQRSNAKDSTTGHCEIACLHLAKPFPTYPRGFPSEVIDSFAKATGRPVIGNVVASGTAVIDDFGGEHMRTGAWIVYT